uniref:RNA polymerase I-specific transcription initiation factor RRN6 n=1 Tax=Talaromyces marneffei PM1 TaxID=1077442 RepID=A0A093V485_TALMA
MDDHTYGLAIQYGNPVLQHILQLIKNGISRDVSDPSLAQIISYTGYEKQVVAPSAVELPVIRKKDKDTNALLEDYPELISIASSFAREEELSQTIQEAESQFNPQISSVLGFGNAQLSEQVRIRRGRMRTVPIAAFASGQNQNVLSLRLIEAERVVTNLEQDAAFRVPTIGCSRAVDWICNETPIRQIKFADSIENPGDLLAVRLLSSTAIFQPVYHREAQLIDPPELSGLAYSRPQVSHIDPCLVAEIDVSQTGGFTHVDVTFNPWYLKQFAIVDERGHWSIWQLQNIVRLDNGVAPELLHSDFLPCDAADDKGESLTDEVKYDTWGRLEWVRDVNTFIVCGRRNAMLYVLEGTTATSYRIELNWQSSTEWILDVKTCSSQNSLGFILTTTRILCFDFKLADQETQPIRPQFAWLHDRDADDLTLRLTSLTIAEVFQVPVDGYEDGIYSMSDPFFIYVPSRPNANGLNTIRYESPIKQILVKEVEQQIYLSNRVTLEHCPRFIKLFMVDGTMAIHEYLYSKPSGLSSADELKVGREALLLSAVSLLSNKKKRKGDRETTVEPSDNDDVDDINRMPLYLSKPIETRPARVSVDFTKIYSLLSRGDSQHLVRPSVSLPEYQSFRDYVEHLIIAVTNSAEEGHSFVHTMLDIIDNPPVLFDIDDSSHELDWFRSRFLPMEPSAETALCFLPLNVSPERSHEQANVIRSFQPFGVLILYEKLVRDWLFKLPRNLPSWIRISKEKLIRQVSIELSLAGTVQIDIPIPDSVSIVSSQPSLPGRRSSTVSQRDSVNGVADFSKEHNMVTHALLDLKTVSPPSMSILLGGATQDILSLWNVGGDPDFFDLERALEAETGERDFGSRSRSRSAQRTRTRSRSRANSASGRSIRSSPVVPSMKFSGSQPQFDSARLPIRSSQFLPSSQITDSMPMTQAERGVFGSRQAGKKSNVKARKKKRAAGF